MQGVRRRWGRYGALLLGMWIAGCSSSPTDSAALEFDLADIVGTWEWESTTGGIAGTTMTPESEGFDRRLVITNDSRMELFERGESVGATDFTLGRVVEGQSLTPVTVGQPFVNFSFEFVGVDLLGRLTLADPCCDGFIHVLVKTTGS